MEHNSRTRGSLQKGGTGEEIKRNFWDLVFSFPIATKVTVLGFNSVILEILKYDYSAYLRG